MSYEGREEHICGNGHRFMTPCSYGGSLLPKCPYCEQRSVWSHNIDDTNGDEVGFVPEEEWKQFEVTPEETAVCNLGHRHVTKAATYLVPSVSQLRQMEHRWDEAARKLVPLRRK